MASIFDEIDILQKEINVHRPLNHNLLQQVREYYRIGLTYTSNALEGNSLTESETKVVLEEGITIGGKRLVDHLEALGHSDAFDFLYLRAQEKTFTEADIRQFHHLFYHRIDELQAGVYRKLPVFITGSKYPLPAPDQLDRLMEQLMPQLDLLRQERHPVEFSALVHKMFVFIHPFIDGNGRVARLLMNLALLQAGYTVAVIPPIMRAEYINALEKAHLNDKEFIDFIARMMRETQRDYLRLFAA